MSFETFTEIQGISLKQGTKKCKKVVLQYQQKISNYTHMNFCFWTTMEQIVKALFSYLLIFSVLQKEQKMLVQQTWLILTTFYFTNFYPKTESQFFDFASNV